MDGQYAGKGGGGGGGGGGEEGSALKKPGLHGSQLIQLRTFETSCVLVLAVVVKAVDC